MKRSPAIGVSRRPRPARLPRHEADVSLDADLLGLEAGRWQMGEDRGQVRRPEGARLAPAARVNGGPSVARGHRRRRARRRSPLLVELTGVAGRGSRPRAPGRRAKRRGGGECVVRPAVSGGEGGRSGAASGRRLAVDRGDCHGGPELEDPCPVRRQRLPVGFHPPKSAHARGAETTSPEPQRGAKMAE